MEYWLPVQGYEGLYEVSDKGRVKSLDRCVAQISKHGTLMTRIYHGKILKPRVGSKGYAYLQLSKDGKHKTFKIHRLVAIHFVSGYSENLTVNHKDGNKLNNEASNLEWCTIEDNLLHSRETGLKPENEFGKRSPNFRGTVEVIKDGVTVALLNGTKEIREFGLNPAGVSAVLTGRQSHHKNYQFRRLLNEI